MERLDCKINQNGKVSGTFIGFKNIKEHFQSKIVGYC